MGFISLVLLLVGHLGLVNQINRASDVVQTGLFGFGLPNFLLLDCS